MPATINTNRQTVESAIRSIRERDQVPAAAITRALIMQQDMQRTDATLETWIDAVAVLMSWEANEP